VASVRLPSTQLALPVYYIIASAEAASNLARYDGVRYGFAGGDRGESGGQDDSSARLLDELRPAQLLAWRRSAGFGAEVKRRILLGNFVLSSQAYSAYVDKAQRIRALIAAEFQSLFAERRFDAVLTPTATGAAPLAASLGAERARQPVSAFLNDVMTTPANLAGLPAVAVPAGHNAEGLPLSVQVMAPHLRDDTALAVAEAIERAAGFQRPELPRARERKFSHAER
jgi:aspartyl-tRNA(Asn)/glutamyl-tRNA(Gln) amidotransferase subunit A